MLTGGQATDENRAVIEKQLGLDGSMLDRLVHYLGDAIRFDLGTSIMSGQLVLQRHRLRDVRPGRPDPRDADRWRRFGGDGFLIQQPMFRRAISEITDGLAPALRRRGLIRDG